MRWLRTTSAALIVVSISPIASGQKLSVRDNINSESFSGAPVSPKGVADAVIRFQFKQSLSKLDDVGQFEQNLQALPIEFGLPHERDYIVLGRGPGLTGADNDWFWLVRMLPSGPRVVLWLHCLNFAFDKGRTHGLLNLSNEWNSPTEEFDETFQSNGARYVRVAHKDKPFVGGH
jgi:hypothetical protein